MQHPDWPAFLNAIVADPEENSLRLVAADFLDENGNPDRAAFIRVQIALVNLETSGLRDSREASDLLKRELAYIGPRSVFRPLWAAEECPELVSIPTSGQALHVEGADRLVWRRGFVERVFCPAAVWLRHGVVVRERNPVREVALSVDSAMSRDAWYAGLPALKGVPDLLLYGAHRHPDADFTEWLLGWLPGTKITAQ